MKNRVVLATLVMMVTVLSAFAVAAPATPAKAASADTGTLYLAMQKDMPDFNYFNLGSNSVWKSNVIGWGFESLAGIDYNMLPYPLLAEDWHFYESNLTTIIHLRQGVLFHDGQEMTADDVVFTYSALRAGATLSSNIILAFDGDDDDQVSQAEIDAGVQKIDDYTVKMVMAKPYGAFFTSTLGVYIIPEHIWKPDHVDADGLLIVAWGDDPAASIATGPYKYKEGVSNTYRVMERNEQYWGKDFVTPAGYKLFPPNVKTLYFKVYASLDTAILALQGGDVDIIMWAVTAGRVPSLQQDPNIRLSYLEENGYYYLAFNMKREPMNNLSFRKAVSHLIDKDQIVNVYMGGLGGKGSACLPPYWGDWMNESVEKYAYDDPFDPTTTTSEDILDTAGYVDSNDDGWRELPDGSPMEKIILLTPPADYDPIRIRAGQAIAKNMREIGINVEAKAIDFDTLVARSNSYDYQMLTLGWQMGTEAMSNVFDIMGAAGTGNYWGFWPVESPNPLYGDMLGVNTLADEATQELSREVDRLGVLAQQSFILEDQIKYTRWAEGVVANAVPCNVLYYKVNIEAYRNSWTGWQPWYGTLIAMNNIYSLSSLQRTGAVTPGGATATVNAGLTLPGKVEVGEAASGYVLAVDNDGFPVSGASVAMSVDPFVVGGVESVTVSPASGTTDASGVFEFTATGVANGYSFVTATVTKGTVSSNDTTLVRAVTEYPPTLYMSVTPDRLVLGPGESTNVHLNVVDQNGDPVEGANLTVDSSLIGYGSVEDLYSLTDADGRAMTVYNSPATIAELNGHLLDTLSYNVALSGYSWKNAAAATIVVYNANAPDWVMARVNSVTSTALDTGANQTTIEVQVVDDTGTALANHKLDALYSDETMVFDVNSRRSVVTDGSGIATLDVQLKDMANSSAMRVTLINNTVTNSVGAVVTLTYIGTNPPVAEMYGGYLTYAETAQYLGPLESLTVTASVWDSSGAPADGVNASLLLGSTVYGPLTWCDDINYDSALDYMGINVATFADHIGTSITGGINTPFVYDNWLAYGPEGEYWFSWNWGDMTGVPITAGSLTFVVYGVNVAHADALGKILVVPDGIGYMNESGLVTGSPNYQVDGQTTLQSDYVVGRGYEVMTPTYEIVKPAMVAKLSNYDSTAVNVIVKDQDNNTVEGADVLVYENSRRGNSNYWVEPGEPPWSDPVQTDVNGEATETIWAIPNAGVPSASIMADVYVKASLAGAVATFGQTNAFIYVNQSFLRMDAVKDVRAMGSWNMTAKATVTDWNGDPLEGMNVSLSSDIGIIALNWNLSDENGVAVFKVDMPSLEDTAAAYMSLQALTAAPGYEVSVASMKVALQNKKPDVVASVVAEGGGALLTDVNISLVGSVTDPNGLESVSVAVDGGTAQAVAGPALDMFGNQIRDVSRVLGKLSAGDHTVRISATDGLGISVDKTITFTVSEPVKEKKAETNWALVAAAIAGWVIAVVVIAMLLMKRQKMPGAAAEEPETEKAEEPKT